MHLGNLYNAIIGERLAHQNGGTFFLRIEDTDAKREVEGAVELVISAMDFFGIHFDEGASVDGDNGAYGPYRQRLRKSLSMLRQRAGKRGWRILVSVRRTTFQKCARTDFGTSSISDITVNGQSAVTFL